MNFLLTLLASTIIGQTTATNVLPQKMDYHPVSLSEAITDGEDKIIVTSDLFQQSYSLLINNSTYQKLNQNWSYFSILQEISQFKVENFQSSTLPSIVYEGLTSVLVQKESIAEINKVIVHAPLGIIINIQSNINFGYILYDVLAQQ